MRELRKCLILFTFLIGAFNASAQEIDAHEVNPYSVRPIRSADIMFKRTMWLRIDLREKINEPYNARGNRLPDLIIQAAKDGMVRPFINDSLQTRMSDQEFRNRLKEEDSGGGDDEWGDWGGGADSEIDLQKILLVDVKEDVIYDKRRGVWKNDIQAISLTVPAEFSEGGYEKVIASFSYKELVDNLFKDNKFAIWYNEANLSENRNLEESFDLRLFNARVLKFTTARDEFIQDIYTDPKTALYKGLDYQMELVEYEANLWSN
ncbi:type IX secretion system ring subunit PorN/GldN [Sediminitomix flava]|uniref:Gliding motility associated protein GldN n=1 Tax=Sediminitomix flava TaxID=379075 RepID=A0A315Z7Z2_SEDFL|nr:gliding motility protein GldN [Sediminitomix flava]PWJ40778.1 gliding motility associated protein GldN [Sediminitomix flava]